MTAAPTSFVWALFQVHDKSDAVAECLICHKGIKRGRESAGQKSFSTSPLHNHLKKHHPKEYQSAKDNANITTLTSDLSSSVKPKEKKITAMNKQLTLMDSLASKKIWDINDPRSRAVNEKIMKMMALDNQPFTMVEDDGFIELMAHLQPRYLLPSRRYFSDTMLPRVYDELKDRVKKELSEPHGSYISFTSDIWTCSSSKEAFISLSGHWIKQDLHELMRFSTQLTFLAPIRESKLQKCCRGCGQAGISAKNVDNFLFEMGQPTCVWAESWGKSLLFIVPSTDFNSSLKTQC